MPARKAHGEELDQAAAKFGGGHASAAAQSGEARLEASRYGGEAQDGSSKPRTASLRGRAASTIAEHEVLEDIRESAPRRTNPSLAHGVTSLA